MMLLAATRTDLERVILSEVRQKDRYILYGEFFLKVMQMNLFTKEKQIHRLRK